MSYSKKISFDTSERDILALNLNTFRIFKKPVLLNINLIKLQCLFKYGSKKEKFIIYLKFLIGNYKLI